ncbi:MAG: glutamate--tRNA ligase [Alphaproteobacteria bacterium]|nr:glutamate--tRNA ligase [Alphaproteobacteria bacterium]
MTLVRFAPSPTGFLHVGNARVALINWLFARKSGGRFLLRLDDTDPERDRPDYAAAIERDLAWLGITWDSFARQSDRMDRYREAAERLKAMGRLYACYETGEELALKRKAQLASGRAPRYERASSAAEAAYVVEGRKPYWRFALGPGRVVWEDLVRGRQDIDTAEASDPVLIRADGRPLYTLSSVVDDIDFAVSHVIRGEDHVANTAVQIRLIEALGGTPPGFAHLPLLAGAAGESLSKRLGSMSLALYRDQGIEAVALASLLARLGTSDAIEPAASLEAMVAGFDLGHVARATPRFDPDALRRLNAKVLHGLDFASVAPRLAVLGLADGGRSLWPVVRGNVETLADVATWATVVNGPLAGEASELAVRSVDFLPPEPWGEGSWKSWTGAVAAATGTKGKGLFRPLRLALTGRDHGPEMQNLLPLIGRARALARLRGETA